MKHLENLITRCHTISVKSQLEGAADGKGLEGCSWWTSWPISPHNWQLIFMIGVFQLNPKFLMRLRDWQFFLVLLSCLWSKSADFFFSMQVWVKIQVLTKKIISWIFQLMSADISWLNVGVIFLLKTWILNYTCMAHKESADFVEKQLSYSIQQNPTFPISCTFQLTFHRYGVTSCDQSLQMFHGCFELLGAKISSHSD